jgi:hypothetical protein
MWPIEVSPTSRLEAGETARGFFGVQKHKKVKTRVVPGILIADFLRSCGNP